MKIINFSEKAVLLRVFTGLNTGVNTDFRQPGTGLKQGEITRNLVINGVINTEIHEISIFLSFD